MSDIRKALEALESVLCDPEGKAGIHGSDADMKIIDDALDQLRADLAQPQAAQPEPSEEIQELRAQVEAWRKQCETLTNQVICCGVAARHPDATLTTRGAYAGKWNSPQAEEVRKLRAERDALLAASPQPAPSAQAVAELPDEIRVPLHRLWADAGYLIGRAKTGDTDLAVHTIKALCDELERAIRAALAASPQPEPSAQAVAHPSHQTVREWMPVSEALRLSDLWTAGDLDNCGQWRAAIKVLADEVRALAASPQPAEPSAQGEPPRFFDLLFELAQTGHISDLGITGEAMRQIRAALAASPQPEPSAQGEPVAWISPKDRVPKGGEVVLCLFRDKGIHTALFRGTSTTHGVFEAWHGFLVADLPTDRVIGWVPLASAPSTPPPAVVEAVSLDEHVHAVVRSVQPYLDVRCRAWQELTEQCRYWLKAERAHGIAPKAAQEKT